MKYWRIAFFSFVVLLALVFPGVTLAGMLGWNHLIFGHTAEDVGRNFRITDNVATCTTVSLAYVWFLWPIASRFVIHAMIIFFVVEAIQSFAALIFADSIAEAFAWKPFFIDALYAAIGLMLVYGWRLIRSNAKGAEVIKSR